MIPDYTPAPCKSIVSAGQFVGSESDRATFLRKLADAEIAVPEAAPKPQAAPGALRQVTPKVIANRPAVQPGPTRVRKAATPKEPKPDGERKPRKDRREIVAGDIFHNWTIVEELPPYIPKSGKKYRMFSCRCSCKTVKPVKLNDLLNDRRTNCVCQGGKTAAIVALRMSGLRPKAIAEKYKLTYERIRDILMTAAETDPVLAALIERERDPRGRKLASRDVCFRKHSMSGDNLIERKSGKRECRACAKIREIRQADKRKAQRKARA